MKERGREGWLEMEYCLVSGSQLHILCVQAKITSFFKLSGITRTKEYTDIGYFLEGYCV